MCATVVPKSYYIGEGKQKRKKGCFAMKKLVLILTVLLLLGSLFFGVSASEQEECPDSSVVSDEILAQLDMGKMTWGYTKDGWVSMDYIKMAK